MLVIDTRKGLPPSPSHRVLAAAKPYFRTAMIKRITVALDEGLEPGRVSRALSLVVEAREFDAECLLLKQALEQARIEQRVGGCADCGTQDRHSPRCPQFDFTWEDEEPADETPLDDRAAVTDPLALLLQRPVHDNPDQLRDDAEILDWMIVQLARQIAPATDREAMLRAIWTRWRSRVRPDQRVLLDRANEHVRYALNVRRVS